MSGGHCSGSCVLLRFAFLVETGKKNQQKFAGFNACRDQRDTTEFSAGQVAGGVRAAPRLNKNKERAREGEGLADGVIGRACVLSFVPLTNTHRLRRKAQGSSRVPRRPRSWRPVFSCILRVRYYYVVYAWTAVGNTPVKRWHRLYHCCRPQAVKGKESFIIAVVTLTLNHE